MLIDRLFASAICTFARVLTGVRARWFAAPDPGKLRVLLGVSGQWRGAK